MFGLFGVTSARADTVVTDQVVEAAFLRKNLELAYGRTGETTTVWAPSCQLQRHG